MEDKKVSLGQFFTTKDSWLLPHIVDFIKSERVSIAYDPFAGNGNLLETMKEHFGFETIGYDIDETLKWEQNNSLVKIPYIRDSIIITNPPYLSKSSCHRKKMEHIDFSNYSDLYLIALEKMITTKLPIVAIIPETFINSIFARKDLLTSITILENNPFSDTDVPVVVACFDCISKHYDEIKIYKNEDYIFTLKELEECRWLPDYSVKLQFNDKDGWLGIRCIDLNKDKICFDFKDNIDYDWNKISYASRLYTSVSIDIPKELRTQFVLECNRNLKLIRSTSHDLVLSPFKGNMADGTRRRRIDYRTCRAILEHSFKFVSVFKEDLENYSVKKIQRNGDVINILERI